MADAGSYTHAVCKGVVSRLFTKANIPDHAEQVVDDAVVLQHGALGTPGAAGCEDDVGPCWWPSRARRAMWLACQLWRPTACPPTCILVLLAHHACSAATHSCIPDEDARRDAHHEDMRLGWHSRPSKHLFQAQQHGCLRTTNPYLRLSFLRGNASAVLISTTPTLHL